MKEELLYKKKTYEEFFSLFIVLLHPLSTINLRNTPSKKAISSFISIIRKKYDSDEKISYLEQNLIDKLSNIEMEKRDIIAKPNSNIKCPDCKKPLLYKYYHYICPACGYFHIKRLSNGVPFLLTPSYFISFLEIAPDIGKFYTYANINTKIYEFFNKRKFGRVEKFTAYSVGEFQYWYAKYLKEEGFFLEAIYHMIKGLKLLKDIETWNECVYEFSVLCLENYELLNIAMEANEEIKNFFQAPDTVSGKLKKIEYGLYNLLQQKEIINENLINLKNKIKNVLGYSKTYKTAEKITDKQLASLVIGLRTRSPRIHSLTGDRPFSAKFTHEFIKKTFQKEINVNIFHELRKPIDITIVNNVYIEEEQCKDTIEQTHRYIEFVARCGKCGGAVAELIQDSVYMCIDCKRVYFTEK